MAEVKPRHDAIAVELLNREYGPSKHPADPGRNFTVCFRTTSHAHQVRELAQAIADAESRGAESTRAWIPCSERMPVSNHLVQFAVAHVNGPCVGYRGADCGKGHEWQDYTDQDACGDCATYSDEQVTHWAPLLPAPPAPTKESK